MPKTETPIEINGFSLNYGYTARFWLINTFLRHRTLPYLSQHLHHLIHLRRREHTFRPLRIDVGKRRFIQSLRLHHPVLGQVIDDKVDELTLVSCHRRTRDELAECLLCSFMVQPDQRADEQERT